jgi:soluble lytic murein transglycosylase-like protein
MNLATLFFAMTTMYHLPPDLLSKVCFVESSYRKNIIKVDSNGLHSVGICQIQLRTAQSLGFKGTEKDLLDPRINVKYAGAYLSYQFDRYGSWVKAIKAYNAGFARTDKPNRYYRKVCSVDLGKEFPSLLVSVK